MVRTLDGVLVDGQPLIVGRVGPVDQTGEVATGLAVLLDFDRNTGNE